uniref:Uncharacterized protein n=1 Tax=Pseudomonas aeruginosa TaxID=287 RepID=A0A894X5W7_PSEAI|nr:hypothetical protein [Pseudomonas aeruginosa]
MATSSSPRRMPTCRGAACAICVIAWLTAISTSTSMWCGRRYRNGCRRCSSNCPPCVRMPTMKTVTTKAWSHDQSSRRCSAPLACSIPRPMSRARARPSGWPQRT